MAPRKKTSKEAKPTTAKPRAPPKPSKPAAKPKPNATKPQKTAEGRKAIWAGKVFVLLGDLHPQYSHGDIERWILHHGGRVHKEVTSETTHLICTIEEFKNKVTHGGTFLTTSARPESLTAQTKSKKPSSSVKSDARYFRIVTLKTVSWILKNRNDYMKSHTYCLER